MDPIYLIELGEERSRIMKYLMITSRQVSRLLQQARPRIRRFEWSRVRLSQNLPGLSCIRHRDQHSDRLISGGVLCKSHPQAHQYSKGQHH